MKKAQVSSKLLTYLLAIAIGLVIFYVVYLGANALFSAGKIYAVKECKLVGEFHEALNLYGKNIELEKAIQLFQEVISECKDTEYEHQSYYWMAGVYGYRQQKYSDAISTYRKVFGYGGVRDDKYVESAADAQNQICFIYYYRLKDYDNALKECEKLSVYSYNDYDTYRYFYLGVIYFEKGENKKAKTNFDEFINIHPGDEGVKDEARDYLLKMQQP